MTTAKDILGELREHGIIRRIPSTSPRFVLAQIEIGLFENLPFRANLFLEIPVMPREQLRADDWWALPLNASAGLLPMSVVPDMRAWSVWDGGPDDHRLVRSHHIFPDESMCVCMPGEWQLERDPLVEYVDFCTIWIAKALHEREFGFYPGPQHYPARRRVERDRPNEYCGCGREKRYEVCCRRKDQALTVPQRLLDEMEGRLGYLRQLDAHQRSRGIAPEIAREISRN
ncbi:MAG: hypothetical protein ACYCVE_05990 [Gemmatimonadaceae bacterium]